jgi:hypothetical protein
MSIKTYTELLTFKTWEERVEYLWLDAIPGEITFGGLRHLNQQLYRSPHWRRIREQIILRDNGCDLGIPDRQIHTKIFVHHMNPITPHILQHEQQLCFDPEYLICVSEKTHNMIHYAKTLPKEYKVVERQPGDTKLW